MNASLDPDVAESVTEFVQREVAAGFTPVEEIVSAAVEYVSDEASPDLLQPFAEDCLRNALERHFAEQKGWSTRTDCDRLDAAFAALEESGIVARQNFTCCQTCGHAEIWDEIKDRPSTLPAARGYTFYHSQDTDSAVEGGGMFLAYGATVKGDDPVVAVGHEIVAALRAQGLDPAWDGSTKTRIRVPLKWQRRR